MKILIVEDNMILCGLIEKWLQKAGYDVLTAIDEPGARFQHLYPRKIKYRP